MPTHFSWKRALTTTLLASAMLLPSASPARAETSAHKFAKKLRKLARKSDTAAGKTFQDALEVGKWVGIGIGAAGALVAAGIYEDKLENQDNQVPPAHRPPPPPSPAPRH